MSGNLAARRRPALRRAWHRWTRAAAAVCAGLALVAIGSAAAPTSAAWVNPAYFTTSASSGTWVVTGCAVIMPNGQVRPGSTCGSVTMTMTNVQDLWVKGSIAGRRADVTVTFSQSGWSSNGSQKTSDQDVVRLTLDMRTAVGGPADWNHTTSGPYGWSNLAFTSQCSAMPVLVAQTTYWVANGQNSLGFAYAEDRSKAPGILCQS